MDSQKAAAMAAAAATAMAANGGQMPWPQLVWPGTQMGPPPPGHSAKAGAYPRPLFNAQFEPLRRRHNRHHPTYP
jgi:hypothetical protein